MKDNSHETYRKITALVYFFIFDRSKWIFPAGIGISHSREYVQYSSAQHDTLNVDYYSFWYINESGEKEQFLHCTYGGTNIMLGIVSVEENPDASTLIRLSKVYRASKAEFIYALLEKMFVFVSHGLTVDQYKEQRCEYWRSVEEKKEKIAEIQNDIIRFYFAKNVDSSNWVISNKDEYFPSLGFKVKYDGREYEFHFCKSIYWGAIVYCVKFNTEQDINRGCNFCIDLSFSRHNSFTYVNSSIDECLDILTLALTYIQNKN